MRILAIILFSFLLATECVEAQRMRIAHLEGDLYVVTTFTKFNGVPFPSNSLYMLTDEGAVLFDTPWNASEVGPLLDSIQLKHKKKVILCIVTHYHDDRTAGLDLLRTQGVKTYSSRLTWTLAGMNDKKQASATFSNDTTFLVGNRRFETFYPGEGHTKDNIVIWFGSQKILFGGCFVKSTDTDGLGNIADANVTAWPNSIQRLILKFPTHKKIVPGHMGWESNGSLEHTLELLKKNSEK
jgi:glyoxylase-like metal-dependent hydrolase (beta-lactamase superfamily II)